MLRALLLLVVGLGLSTLTACVTPRASAGGPDVAVGDSTEEALADARARWQAAGLDAYRFVYEASCFCPPEARGPFTITVRDGAVQEVRYEGRTVDPADPRHPTVDVLFAQLADAFDRKAETVRVTYDDALGYPATAYVDYEAQMADEELRFTIRSLTRLDG